MNILFVISGFRREVTENCTLLGYYAASSGNSLPTFRETCRSHLQGFLTHEDVTYRLSLDF